MSTTLPTNTPTTHSREVSRRPAITLDAQPRGGSVNTELAVQTEGKHYGNSLPGARSTFGFSLIELLIVAALLIVLSMMYFGSSSPIRQRSAKQKCEANLQKIFLAHEIYAHDNSGKFPAVASAQTSEEPLDLLVPRYTVDRDIFICPGSKDSPLPSAEPLRAGKISYSYYMGRRSDATSLALMSDAQVNTNSKIAGDAIFSSTGNAPGNNHHQFGGNILFCDGHVELSGSNVVIALPLGDGVGLLNPKR